MRAVAGLDVTTAVYNPAFDVTPAEFASAIITERGVARAPFAGSLAVACCGTGAIHELG